MKVNHSFLKRTYDKYNNSDFKYGQDNLNPLRDMNPIYEEDRILKKVNKRISAIEEALKDIPLKEQEEEKIGFPINDFPSYVNNKINNIVIPGVTSYPAGSFTGIKDLEEKVTGLISEIGIIIPDGGDDPYREPNFPDLYKINCDGLDFDTLVNGAVPTSVSGNGGDETSGNQINNGEGTGSGDNGQNLSENNNDPLAALQQCALLDLWWLKIILIIIWIIKILMLIVSLVFSIIIPISKMFRDTCVCWIDPPALNCAITLNCEVIVSLVMTIISIVLSIVFSLLKFDCITDVTQEILDAIKEALSGVISGIELGSSLAVSIKSMKADASKEEKKKFDWKVYKDQLKKMKEERKAAGLTTSINADVIEQIMSTASDAADSITQATLGKTFGAADAAEMLNNNEAIKSISEQMKAIGINKDVGDLSTIAFDTAKQLFNMSNSESGFEFNVDTSAFDATKKKIKDNWDRFVALCKSPYDKAKKAIDNARG